MKNFKLIICLILACSVMLAACNNDSESGSESGIGGTDSTVQNVEVPKTDEDVDGVWKDNENVNVNGGTGTPEIQNPQKPLEENLQSKNTLHKVSVKESNIAFVTKGQSAYKVLIPKNANNSILTAANYFVKYVKMATGCELPVEANTSYSWDETRKWIVFGRTELFKKAGLTMPEEDIGIAGYYIKSKGNSVFVEVEDNFGYQRAALSLLDHIVGYEMYWNDIVRFEKTGETLPEMEIIERPDFAFYQESNSLEGDGRYGMGFNTNIWIYVEGAPYHNSFKYLPKNTYQKDHPKWYSEKDQGGSGSGTQLCYTARGDVEEYNLMVQTVADKVLYYAAQNPNLATITITQEDTHTWCGCDTCKKMAEDYNGSNAVTAVKFVNAVDTIVQRELQREADKNGTKKRNLNIVIFAYRQSEQPPAKRNADGTFSAIDDSVICNPTVGVYIAPIEANYQNSFYTNANAYSRDNIRGWSAICQNLYMWTYDTNFRHYFFPLNSWDSKIETYRFLKENNAYYVHSQSQWNNGAVTHFSRFKDYIDSKASFDVNVNYNELADKFFDNYYGPASAPMRQLFDQIQSYMEYLNVTYPAVVIGNYKENIGQSYLWPQGTLYSFMALIDKAYECIEPLKESDPTAYEIYHEHILLESMFPRYANLKFYRATFSEEQFKQMAMQFKLDCATVGITRESEEKTIDGLWTEWGV